MVWNSRVLGVFPPPSYTSWQVFFEDSYKMNAWIGVLYMVAVKKLFCEIQMCIIACFYVVCTAILGQFLPVSICCIFHVNIIITDVSY